MPPAEGGGSAPLHAGGGKGCQVLFVARERQVLRSFFFYHKTGVAVNALSARVTEGVPINSTLSHTYKAYMSAKLSQDSCRSECT